MSADRTVVGTATGALVLIAAMDLDRAIGRGNALPWHLPNDLKRFKALTLGRPVLMGRKTAESLGRPLPGRRNLVLTRSGRVPFAGMEPVASLEAALAGLADAQAGVTQAGGTPDPAGAGAGALWVIGGGEVYAAALPLAQRMYLTHVATRVGDADAHFPRFEPSDWVVLAREAHRADARHAFDFEFVDYQRRT